MKNVRPHNAAPRSSKTHNWRWFNVMMMTFLKHHGYAIDEQLMLNHVDHLLMLESGEGWFRDTSHDYGLRITLKSGENYAIDFRGIDGSSSR